LKASIPLPDLLYFQVIQILGGHKCGHSWTYLTAFGVAV
jgi:hypothetical protein